jgi:hypothetical protein
VFSVDGIVNCNRLFKRFLVNLAFWIIWCQVSHLSIVFSYHKHLGNWEMKSSTIMVLQTNKQNSALLINFTLFDVQVTVHHDKFL